MTGYRVEDVQDLIGDAGFREQLGRDDEITQELYRECGRRGLFALAVPSKHGGLGQPLADRIRWHRELGGISPSLQSVLTVHEMAVYAIVRFGGSALADRWLPVLATGDCPGAFALTEPTGGSDFADIRTTATLEDEGIRLDGTKSWISSGLRAGLIVVFAGTGQGPAAYCLPGDTAGLSRLPSPAMTAFGAASLATLELRGCVVDPNHRLGPPGLGLIRVAMGCLSVGRVLVASGALGVAAAASAELAVHANGRLVGGRPLATYQAVEQAMVDAHVRIQSGLLLTREAAEAVDDRAPEAVRRAIVAKLAATDAALKTAHDAARLQGAAGLTVDAAVSRYAAQAQVYSIVEGSADALTSALGRSLLREGRAA
ncbi:acyl-CoA dehydrogenase family protein [Mesorhizobium sp. M6A.T.Ce.TU.016.01.1.1]|uniref:acyl-CoA dehydrogenase family protein n=1 Tax=Mesorhizobium sp. M6A.T.Ce.TU.016.01.1.1 TaxID=2496783 RepID=UPI000FCC940B|nr:acyl-CoA dehydrogenase family protein [Mesorhizobium sp. M6A.T.Ce.TU.016.01.1.1]RUU32401.1 acyl-CoA dehydrogenase [Mesorhizobium sp. M6A.T.Ce.TU.016.01.1.1]